MPPEDKLTRAERIRLEALARVQGMNPIRVSDWNGGMREMAEEVEKWLRAARDDA